MSTGLPQEHGGSRREGSFARADAKPTLGAGRCKWLRRANTCAHQREESIRGVREASEGRGVFRFFAKPKTVLHSPLHAPASAMPGGSLLRAFGDGTRLRILNALAKGRQTVGQLAALLGCPKPRLSRHLLYLQARGLVEWERSGNAVAYDLVTPGSDLMQQVLLAVLASLDDVEEARRDSGKLARRRQGPGNGKRVG